jgi:hypothetical protein
MLACRFLGSRESFKCHYQQYTVFVSGERGNISKGVEKSCMKVRLTQLDGKLPNLALMKLAHFYRSNGTEVVLSKSAMRSMFEPEYDLVLGSQIFNFSTKKAEVFKANFPDAVIRGTGTNDCETVEGFLGLGDYEFYDYQDYADFPHSIGFSQRGCRLKCSFCVVPKKEGKVRGLNRINDIWRGEGYPKQIHLLDNDFFGQPEWKERAEEIINGNFEVCFNQGINVRLIHEEGATYLARMKYRDDQFKTKRIYTAWDNRRDEKVFFNGINILLSAGIRPSHILVYMLCGYWKDETFEDIYYRFQKMNEVGLLPYPMVYDQSNKTLKKFQRWVVRRYYQFIDWQTFNSGNASDYYRAQSNEPSLFDEAA